MYEVQLYTDPVGRQAVRIIITDGVAPDGTWYHVTYKSLEECFQFVKNATGKDISSIEVGPEGVEVL